MKTQFASFLNLTEQQFAHLWDTAVFSFDTSVLLDLYRYKQSTSDQFLSLAKKLREHDRVWLPYHVGLEFFRNRPKVIKNQFPFYKKLESHLDQSLSSLRSHFPRHSHVDVEKVYNTLESTIIQIKTQLDETKSIHDDRSHTANDSILQALISIFDGRIGIRPQDSERDKRLEECKQRAAKMKPPGTLKSDDQDKETNPFGDAIIWLALIDYVKETKRPLVFVTSEKKSDWWWYADKEEKQLVGPRYEMIESVFPN